MNFFQVWLTGYYNPFRVVDELKTKPAPQWGVYAQLTRALLDSLVLYLPLAFMGREPSTPSYLTFLPTELLPCPRILCSRLSPRSVDPA